MSPKGFDIQYTGADAATYTCYMSLTADLPTPSYYSGNSVDAAHASLDWLAGIWTLHIFDDGGTDDFYTAPSADPSIVPTDVAAWTRTTFFGLTLIQFDINVP